MSKARLILSTGRLPPWSTAREPGEPRCARCLYDMSGADGQQCPECGAACARGWYSGAWPAGCRARASLAAAAVMQNVMLTAVSLISTAAVLFAANTIRRLAPGMGEVGGWFALPVGTIGVQLAVSVTCLVIAWRRYAWIRYGPPAAARLGVLLVLIPLATLAISAILWGALPTAGEP